MKVELAARAMREAERGSLWWRENRPAARLLFDEELRRALDQIRSEPNIGVPYTAGSGRGYRRLLMPTTRYHVYYRVVEHDRIRVAAIWSAARGRTPSL